MEKCYVTDVTDLMDGRYGCDGQTDGPMDRETCQLKYYFRLLENTYFGVVLFRIDNHWDLWDP